MRAQRVNSTILLAIGMLLAGMPDAARAQQASPSTRVLMLYGVPPEAPAISAFTRRFRVGLTGGLPEHVEFYAEFLDLDRFRGPERRPQLSRYFGDKYRGYRVDLIVAVGASALQFAVDRLNGVFPGVPVVAALVTTQAIDTAARPANVTGRLTPQSHTKTLAMARSLQPDAERIVVVGGAAVIDSIAVSIAVQDIGALHDSVEVEVLRALPLELLLEHVRRLPPKTIVLFTTFRRDGRGRGFVTAEVVASVAREARAPVYGNNRFWIGDGIVGGSVVDGDEEGTHTAELALRVLRRGFGEPLPPLETTGSAFVVDWRQLRRWGLSERRLPPGTTILFRPPPVWEGNRTTVLGTLLLVATQSMLIVLLWLERRRRIRAQQAVEDRVAYERTMAELTTDAVRHAPDESPQALENALARVGKYAGASAAVLVQYADAPFGPATRLFWTAPEERSNGNGSSRTGPSPPSHGDSRLEIPLVADGAPIGALELYRSHSGEWPPPLLDRLDAASELIAGAMARSRAAKAIRRGEELNRAVLSSLSSQIAILDRNGTIIRVNESWRELGRRGGVDPRRDAFLGDNYLDECRRAEQRGCPDAFAVRMGIESVLRGETSLFRSEYDSRSSPPSRWYELSVDRLDYTGGGAIVSHLDITDRRVAELRDEETRRQIAHMGRVAMVGELAAAMSHELRQPLAAIRVNAEAGAMLLGQDPPDITEAREVLKDIAADDVRASEVIDHIRMLLRKQEPTKTTVDVNEICRQAVHLMRHDAVLRGATIELSLEARLPGVTGDPVQLQQVVLNLVLNALDAVATDGGSREVVVGTAVRNGEVEVFIRDNGPGLARAVQPHLFESFFSTKAKGLGMGLVIVRTIVERHHGRVRAENHAAGGAVFRVLLPAG